MSSKKSPAVIDEQSVKSMITTGDFTPVEGHVPDFISTLLALSPGLMEAALKASLENSLVRKEFNAQINEMSNLAIEKQSSIVYSEIANLGEVNKTLAETLLQLSKIKDKTVEEIQLYFATLQQLDKHNAQIAESREQNKKFLESTQQIVIDATKKKDSWAKNALKHVIDNPDAMQHLVKVVNHGLDIYRMYKRG